MILSPDRFGRIATTIIQSAPFRALPDRARIAVIIACRRAGVWRA